MYDMLTAFHLVRYLEMRRKEREPARDVVPDDRFALALHLSRKRREETPAGCDSRK
jgi:hypothetical protein